MSGESTQGPQGMGTTPPEKQEPVTFQYKTVTIEGSKVSSRKITSAINSMANAGWELTNQSQSEKQGFFGKTTVTLTFRRPKKSWLAGGDQKFTLGTAVAIIVAIVLVIRACSSCGDEPSTTPPKTTAPVRPSPAKVTPAKAKAQLQKAQELFNKGNLKEAEPLFRQLATGSTNKDTQKAATSFLGVIQAIKKAVATLTTADRRKLVRGPYIPESAKVAAESKEQVSRFLHQTILFELTSQIHTIEENAKKAANLMKQKEFVAAYRVYATQIGLVEELLRTYPKYKQLKLLASRLRRSHLTAEKQMVANVSVARLRKMTELKRSKYRGSWVKWRGTVVESRKAGLGILGRGKLFLKVGRFSGIACEFDDEATIQHLKKGRRKTVVGQIDRYELRAGLFFWVHLDNCELR